MALYLAFDTSNYTTSAALFDTETNTVIHEKKLLPVRPGEKGIRQSDAVFHHTLQLREVFSKLCIRVREHYGKSDSDKSFDADFLTRVSAVGVSYAPRRAEGSYMPCFTVGLNAAHMAADLLGVPCYEFSHQEGHIAAALYSADRLSLMGDEFLAFHVSGGTTESLLIKPTDACIVTAELLGESEDLKAGQAIDRVGVMLGLSFPCGAALEKLAEKSDKTYKTAPFTASPGCCSLSGVENKCKKMYEDGEPAEDIALYCLKCIETALVSMTKNARGAHPGLPVVYSGGVMSNSLIRSALLSLGESCFAAPEFSSDNAAGTAVLAARKDGIWKR